MSHFSEINYLKRKIIDNKEIFENLLKLTNLERFNDKEIIFINIYLI